MFESHVVTSVDRPSTISRLVSTKVFELLAVDKV